MELSVRGSNPRRHNSVYENTQVLLRCSLLILHEGETLTGELGQI